MAGDGLLSLRWNNHRTSFLQVLSSLKDKQTYSDVTLACGGKFYSVHKFVLSTCSDYFVEIMEKTPCKHPIIVLKDICHQDLEALLNYMYLGEVNVLQNELAGLIKAAECLKIKGLAVPDESPPPHLGRTSQNPVSWDEGSPQTKKRKNDDDSASSNSSPPRKMSNSVLQSEGPIETAVSEVKIETKENGTRDTEITNNQHDQTQEVSTNEHTREGSQPISEDDHQEKHSEVENPDIKVEEEDVKYEDENGIHLPDTCSSLEVQMIESEESSRGPVRNNEATLKYESSLPGSTGGVSLRPSVTQHYSTHPQSFEEIVSQALPGPSGIQGDSGQCWDGNPNEGDMTPFHLRGFPQQDGLTPHHRGLQQMGQVRSGWGLQGSRGHPLQQLSVVATGDGHSHHSYQRPVVSGDGLTSYIDGSQQQAKDEVTASFDKRFCQICGYKGQDVSQLRKHLRIHTGEKPYQCPKCDYCSAQSSNLRVHMKRHHPELCQQEAPRDFLHIFTDAVMLD